MSQENDIELSKVFLKELPNDLKDSLRTSLGNSLRSPLFDFSKESFEEAAMLM